ncbi:MAG TPA: hypothetical protein VGX48_01415 [Pyrinomonadaceae bacterium]|jgi:hypothetical protein|nr:hypothetical protein [Pyrinomonadaceae bacterium]
MSGPHGRAQDDTEAGSQGPGLRVPFTARPRLVKLLVAKAALDLLFVAALALGSGYLTVRARFRGAVEHADPRTVRGWVADTAEPGRPVEVQLFLGDRFAASTVAEDPAGDGRRAFVFHLDTPAADSEARVYAVEPGADATRRTLRLLR